MIRQEFLRLKALKASDNISRWDFRNPRRSAEPSGSLRKGTPPTHYEYLGEQHTRRRRGQHGQRWTTKACRKNCKKQEPVQAWIGYTVCLGVNVLDCDKTVLKVLLCHAATARMCVVTTSLQVFYAAVIHAAFLRSGEDNRIPLIADSFHLEEYDGVRGGPTSL